MYNFEFERPRSVDDAVQSLGGEALALGGGQTLIPALKQRLNQPDKLVSLTGISELNGISMLSDGRLSVKGATTHATVAEQAREHYPALADLARHIGDPAVRNRGTIGGSLANNDPAACYPAAVLGSDATVVTNAREISASDFFTGMFATVLSDNEIITEVRFQVPSSANYQKFLQPASRFALTGVFVAKFADGVRVAVTGASENGVFRWADAESALAANFTQSAVENLSVSPDGMISDLHGSAAYRASLVKTLTKRAVAAAS